jgi:hypothetical protein
MPGGYPRIYIMKIVTMKRLTGAVADVIRDFEHLGIWNERLYSVDVCLVSFGFCYGWKWCGPEGHIGIPAVSINRLGAVMFGNRADWCLRDIIRHEYGHAVADLYPRLSRSAAFRKAFGRSYDSDKPVAKYSEDSFISTYAATSPAEDFAEMFMLYVKYRGRRPGWHRLKAPAIRRKWQFTRQFVKTVKGGRRTFC